MSHIVGRYELVSSTDNFEAYLKCVGVVLAKRKIAANVKIGIGFTEANGIYTMTTYTPLLKDYSVSFKPGVEFDEITLDGRNAKSIVTIEGNTLTHISRVGDLQAKVVREFDANQMKATCTCSDITAIRVYRRVVNQ